MQSKPGKTLGRSKHAAPYSLPPVRALLGSPGLSWLLLGWITGVILGSAVSLSLLSFLHFFAEGAYFRNSCIKHAAPYGQPLVRAAVHPHLPSTLPVDPLI